MKISDINVDYLKNYFKVDYNDDDRLISHILDASKSFISNYTGLTADEIDLKQDLSIALLVICSEMYDNRQYTVNNNIINPIALSILSMHSINLL